MCDQAISLRLKIRSELVDRLDHIRKSRGLSMNEVINKTLAIALAAKEEPHERINR